MWPWLAAAAWSTEPPVEMELGESALEEPAIEPVPEALAGVVGPHLPAAVRYYWSPSTGPVNLENTTGRLLFRGGTLFVVIGYDAFRFVP